VSLVFQDFGSVASGRVARRSLFPSAAGTLTRPVLAAKLRHGHAPFWPGGARLVDDAPEPLFNPLVDRCE
jgi:hypothetical protein